MDSYAYSGWASKKQLRKRILRYPYPSKLAKPRHLTDVFTKTKLFTTERTGRRAPFIWAPHSDSKVRFSAYEMLIFAVHSLDVFRPFVPASANDDALPAWWMAWKTHVQVMSHSNPTLSNLLMCDMV